jgi:prepilin-type N-terminal cleavage/methylation domain-containing protein
MRNSTQRNVARPARTGFTVTELLVVVAIVGLIVALVIPTIGKVRSKSRTLKCLTNQRTITMANYTYATSNQSRFASPRTDSQGTLYVNGGNVGSGSAHCWVKAEGANLAPGGQFEKPSAIEQGSLYSYIGDIKSYISPDEPTNPLASNISSTGTRVRSYSFNALLGSTRPDELPEFDDDFTSNMYGVTPQLSQYNATTIGTIKSPQRMMATIVEDDSVAYNNEGWLVLPQTSNWIDWPAGWRPDAITMSYVDGSTDSYELANPDLPNNWDSNGHRWQQPADAGAGIAVDWKFFRDRLNPGVIPNSTYLFGN